MSLAPTTSMRLLRALVIIVVFTTACSSDPDAVTASPAESEPTSPSTTAPSTTTQATTPSSTTTSMPRSAACGSTVEPIPLELDEWTVDPVTGLEIQLRSVESHDGALVATDWAQELRDYPGEFVVQELYGTEGGSDPFASGDVAIWAEYNPHDDDYHVVDWSNGYDSEIRIGGRTALIRPWLTDFEENAAIGWEVFWDADPDHYLLARSRSFSPDDLQAVLESVVFDGQGPTFDHGSFGLSPIAVPWQTYYFAGEDYFDLKSGSHINLIVDDVALGEYEDLDIWLVDGTADDVLVWRFLAAAEREVCVRGATGFLLEGLRWRSDYGHSMLVWQESDDTVGVVVADGSVFTDELVDLTDRTLAAVGATG